MNTEDSKVYLECVTTDDKVTKLIDFINKNQPNQYDYPYPDVIVMPINFATPEYKNWVKK